MIIIFECGRLGNQLFQYCALKKIQKDGSFFFIGPQSIDSVIDGLELAGNSRIETIIRQLLVWLGPRWLYSLARKLQLIGLVEEHTTSSDYEYEINNGLFKKIYFCDGYFQSERLIDLSVAEGLSIKQSLCEQALQISRKFPGDRSATFFVHVRRGDYTWWPTRNSPAVLPLKWYKEQMDKIRAEYIKPFFIVVSDDFPYIQEMFGDYQDVFVSNEKQEMDFALMSLCDGGGILSASSFAWWAAYFAKRNSKNALFIAPLYWVGHRKKEWHPKGIETDWINYVAVEP